MSSESRRGGGSILVDTDRIQGVKWETREGEGAGERGGGGCE